MPRPVVLLALCLCAIVGHAWGFCGAPIMQPAGRRASPAGPLRLTCGAAASTVDRRSLLATAAALSYVAWSPQQAQAALPAPTQTWSLGGAVEMPTLALNTVGLSVDDTERAVSIAVAAGIKHVDFHPGKERDGVAKYIASSAAGRSGLFLTTKIRKAAPGTAPGAAAAQAKAQIEEDLRALGVDQVDMLMLRDSPDCATIQAQWAVLEEALEAGQTRSIGVINFCQSALECVLQAAKVKPAVNYYMLHVGMGPDAHGLRSFGEKRGVRTFACKSLSRSDHLR